MHWIWGTLIVLNLVGLIWTYLSLAAIYLEQKKKNKEMEDAIERTGQAVLEGLRALNAVWGIVQADNQILGAIIQAAKKPTDPPFSQPPATGTN